MQGRFSEEWWEHISLVNTIMLYKLNIDKWGTEEMEQNLKNLIKDSHADIERIEKKLDLIMEKLNIDKI